MQYDTPEAILASPANAFVEAFVGADRALKRLSLIDAQSAMAAVPATLPAHSIAPQTSLKDALALMLAEDVDALAVVDARGVPVGALTLAHIRAHTHARLPDA